MKDIELYKVFISEEESMLEIRGPVQDGQHSSGMSQELVEIEPNHQSSINVSRGASSRRPSILSPPKTRSKNISLLFCKNWQLVCLEMCEFAQSASPMEANIGEVRKNGEIRVCFFDTNASDLARKNFYQLHNNCTINTLIVDISSLTKDVGKAIEIVAAMLGELKNILEKVVNFLIIAGEHIYMNFYITNNSDNLEQMTSILNSFQNCRAQGLIPQSIIADSVRDQSIFRENLIEIFVPLNAQSCYSYLSESAKYRPPRTFWYLSPYYPFTETIFTDIVLYNCHYFFNNKNDWIAGPNTNKEWHPFLQTLQEDQERIHFDSPKNFDWRALIYRVNARSENVLFALSVSSPNTSGWISNLTKIVLSGSNEHAISWPLSIRNVHFPELIELEIMYGLKHASFLGEKMPKLKRMSIGGLGSSGLIDFREKSPVLDMLSLSHCDGFVMMPASPKQLILAHTVNIQKLGPLYCNTKNITLLAEQLPSMSFCTEPMRECQLASILVESNTKQLCLAQTAVDFNSSEHFQLLPRHRLPNTSFLGTLECLHLWFVLDGSLFPLLRCLRFRHCSVILKECFPLLQECTWMGGQLGGWTLEADELRVLHMEGVTGIEYLRMSPLSCPQLTHFTLIPGSFPEGWTKPVELKADVEKRRDNKMLLLQQKQEQLKEQHGYLQEEQERIIQKVHLWKGRYSTIQEQLGKRERELETLKNQRQLEIRKLLQEQKEGRKESESSVTVDRHNYGFAAVSPKKELEELHRQSEDLDKLAKKLRQLSMPLENQENREFLEAHMEEIKNSYRHLMEIDEQLEDRIKLMKHRQQLKEEYRESRNQILPFVGKLEKVAKGYAGWPEEKMKYEEVMQQEEELEEKSVVLSNALHIVEIEEDAERKRSIPAYLFESVTVMSLGSLLPVSFVNMLCPEKRQELTLTMTYRDLEAQSEKLFLCRKLSLTIIPGDGDDDLQENECKVKTTVKKVYELPMMPDVEMLVVVATLFPVQLRGAMPNLLQLRISKNVFLDASFPMSPNVIRQCIDG